MHGAEYGRDTGFKPLSREREFFIDNLLDTGFEPLSREREFLVDNLPVQIQLIIEMVLVDRPGAFPHSSCADTASAGVHAW